MDLLIAIKEYCDKLIEYNFYPKKKKPSLGKLEKYADLMNITERTLDDYNTFKSARTMCQVSGIQIAETLPELLYYAVSAILALCLGCGFVVVQALRKQE